MAQERLKLHNFEEKTFRRDYGIIVSGIITANCQVDDQEVIWLQVGKLKNREIELTAGFADIKINILRRGPSVEKIDGKLQSTRRSAWWVRMQDVKDARFYSREK